MESGNVEGFITTTKMSITGKMKLVVNISFPTGYFGVEVLKEDGSVLDGYAFEDSVVNDIDECEHHVKWKEKDFVEAGIVKSLIRFRFMRGSFFSYKWEEATC
jgi:hypothetical protein